MDLIEQATRLQHRAVEIHPFPNGNGRWSRMLANIWLALHDHPHVAWPDTTIGVASSLRDDYIKALKAADQGDLELFEAMHKNHLMPRASIPWLSRAIASISRLMAMR